MAKKKPRTPPPPRKVQAPMQRHAPRQGLSADRTRLILYGAAGVGAIAVVIVLILVLAGGKSSGRSFSAASIRPTLAAAGCTLASPKATPTAGHSSSLSQTLSFTTYPPVSGKHYAVASVWGNYPTPVDPRQAVHNQEHGGIVIWVGPDVSAAERKKISEFYDESPNGMLVTPIEDAAGGVKYPKHAAPGSKVFLTAWATAKTGDYAAAHDEIATCPYFDEKAFAAFRDEFRGNGPERFSVDSLQPGT